MARRPVTSVTFTGLVLALLLAMLGTVPAAAEQTHIRPALVAESADPASGRDVVVALVMRPDPGWHGYWLNPGDAGLAPIVEWQLPQGVKAGPLTFPVPSTLLVAGLMNHVYEGEYAHLVTLKLPAGLAPGTPLPLRAAARWLACTDTICVPERAALALDLVVGKGLADPARRGDFDRWRAALPKPLDAPASYSVSAGKFRLAVSLPATAEVREAWFFPVEDGLIDYAAAQSATRSGDRLIVETVARPGAAAGRPVTGVLRLGPNDGLSIVARPGPVPAAGAPLTASGPEEKRAGTGTFLLALGGAVLGGLLLNVMPCVFPILSLKALSLARAGGDQRTARREALAYAAGVVGVCLALGAALLALRAGGAAAGWAFQLQDPRVILCLLLLVAAIGLNLAGLFELPGLAGGDGLAGRGGIAGAFWTGALAAFIATPCTGPFMGAALGAALVLPAASALAVFAGLGLGLALPFLLIGFVPTLRRRLPRPGAWMERLRRVLSLPMFATALGLAWILGRQAGVDGMTLGLAATLLLAVALWWVGLRQARSLRRAWWPVLPAIVAVAGLLLVIPREPAVAAPRAAIAGAEPFSEARLAALRSAGRPVFAYFTADWCLTCKVNEKGAIERPEVARAFQSGKIAVLVGDWTRGDAAIGRFLASRGRSGVPLYLYYPPGRDAEELPQVLTVARLVALGGQ